MTRDELDLLVAFHAWQGAALLDAAALVPEDALRATALNEGTVFDALRHALDVNFSWRCAAEGLPDPGLVWEVEPLEDLANVDAFWRAEDGRLGGLVAGWSEEDPGRLVVPPWRKEPFKLWQVVMHIVTHQSDLAAQIGWALTRMGQSPGEIGFMQYVNTHRAAAGL